MNIKNGRRKTMPSWPPIFMKTSTEMPSDARYDRTTLRIR